MRGVDPATGVATRRPNKGIQLASTCLPDIKLERKERRANARAPRGQKQCTRAPREGSGGRAGGPRAGPATRRPRGRPPHGRRRSERWRAFVPAPGALQSATIDPTAPSHRAPPPRHTALLRTARQEHLPTTAQSSTQPTTGGGKGVAARWPGTTVARRDRRPPVAGRRRHCARPPRLRCARGGGQGSQVQIPCGPHPPSAPRPPRGLGCRQAARKESGRGGSARQAGEPASERALTLPTPPPPLVREPPPGRPEIQPRDKIGWLPLSSPRLRPPPPRPNAAPAAVSPACPVRAHDVWGPLKGLVGGPIRGVSPPSAPRLPPLPCGGGHGSPAGLGGLRRGTSGSVPASLDTALWAVLGVRGLSWTAAGGGRRHSCPCVLFRERAPGALPTALHQPPTPSAPSRTPRARVAAVDDAAVDGAAVASSVGVRVLPGRQGGACVSVPPRSNLPDRTLAPLLSPSPTSSLAFPSAVCSQKLARPESGAPGWARLSAVRRIPARPPPPPPILAQRCRRPCTYTLGARGWPP